MAMPVRVQLRRSKGWKLPPNSVKVARPGKWGNPFPVGQYERQEAIQMFESYLDEQVASGRLNLTELRGKNLACWCRLDEPCHADVLLRKANT